MTDASAPDVCDVADRWMFLRALKASRLVADRQVEAFTDRHPAASLSELKARLVEVGILTAYQVQRVADRRTDGLVLGQYHIQAELGRGGFGQVYLARHALMGRSVALKVIGEQWSREPSGREYFLREVAGSTHLAHPNIALPYDAGECDGRLYLAMEYVDGPTLDAYVSARGLLDALGVAAVLAQTADALRHAHARGVVHRDLKPANLLLASRPDAAGDGDRAPFTVKVIDFGLARFFGHDRGPVGTIMCEAGAVVGTPAYMSPEQAGDVHQTDIRSDLYSLGCTAYFAVTGRIPFGGRTTAQVIDEVLNGSAVPVEQHRPDLPPWVAAVIRRLMARQPDDRYQTPDELLQALAAARDAATPPPARPECAATPEPIRHSPITLFDAFSLLPAATPPDPTEIVAPSDTESVGDFAMWWHEWYRQVQRLAAGRSPDLPDNEYRVLQRTLLRAIRGATDGPVADRRPQLVAVVEPWVSLKTLTALDRRTLADVWAECRRLNGGVHAGGGRRTLLRWWG